MRTIRILFFYFLLLWSLPLFAETIGGYTNIVFTNNTTSNINLNIHLQTADSKFQQGKDWDIEANQLSPYETKKILWFSRNLHIKPGEIYTFTISVMNLDYPTELIRVYLIETGKSVFGSDLSAKLSFPPTENGILINDNFQKFSANFWDKNFTIHSKYSHPLTSIFNNFHFTIDELQNNYFNTREQQKISILTYNTQLMSFYANGVNNLNHPEIRAINIPRKISGYDIVIMEELFDKDLRKTMIAAMQNYYPYHSKVVGHHTTKLLNGGVMIFSKWPILKEDQIVYRACGDIDCFAAKGAAYISINKLGAIYNVFGTHLQAANANGGNLARKNQLIELHEFIQNKNIPPDLPVLIGGDFNIGAKPEEINNLLNTLHVSLISNIGHPYSVDSTINTMMSNHSRRRLDYVFSSREFKKPKSEFNKIFILRDLDNEKMWPDFDLSDHFPVVGYFDFTNH